ncbi:MAG: bacillithiol biosynthesis cysteine-adding enzyme BshC [Bacteroidetes bacterium]|jgi:bacillithiol biosynthesis cysteine-adding enzyme BshC|nr:bacillithiol biosynthesis cysteine-adding enzyme BshC [Bacteroidota bacterium]
MFRFQNTSLKTADVLNPLVQDYIDKKENLLPYYGEFPDIKGFGNILKKDPYTSLNRAALHEILMTQAKTVGNANAKSISNIELLKEKNSYTITTGHQLCLFTGPLYFIYKIFSVINLAEELSKTFPENKFVPVYWAASEDHDFEEVNHFRLFGKTITWESKQTGAVGNFKTQELETLLPQVKEILGAGANSDYLVSLFEKAYLSHSSLAQATRFLVNELFGEYGLITVDGNDKQFKQQFKATLGKDIFENVSFDRVNKTISELENMAYKAQVNPRPINCFFMEGDLRARIEKENNNYKLVGTDRSFTREQLESVIENETEKISPNVVLRPLYQQQILPNLAYVGGPGELAYWLEYKKMFEAYSTFFPLLVPRSFVTLIDKNTKNKTEKLELSFDDLFKTDAELVKLFQVRSNNVFDVDTEKKQIESLFAELSQKIGVIDKTLVNSVSAEQQKAMNSLDTINAKANKALKQRSDTEMNQLKAIKEKLFPGNGPQERYDNFSAHYLKWGGELFTALKENIQPLSLQHSSLIEE